MKKALLTSLLTCLCHIGYCQRFYVEKSEYDSPVISKLLENNFKITNIKDSSDFTISATISKNGWGRAKSYISVFNSKTGYLIAKSKEVNGQTSAFNGYANPQTLSVKRAVDKYLLDIIKSVTIK